MRMMTNTNGEFILDQTMIDKDKEVAFTQEWWMRTTKDEQKMIAWLKKLYGTEVGGYDDYQAFLRRFTLDDRTTKIFTNIGEDELKHGGLIINLLDSRGHKIEERPPVSAYWTEMNERIHDLPTAAAVNYFGEALAAFRFEVILEMPNTPQDVKNLLDVVLPDEQFHRQTLRKIAGEDLIQQFQEYHDAAVKRLKGL